ncbi:MAG: ATP-binding protein [Gammaproteobacteria bacterium]
MLERYDIHNQFQASLQAFRDGDPHLKRLSEYTYQYHFDWWKGLSLQTPGIYTLTGGRQVGKSTSCKQLIAHCLAKKIFSPESILYLTCDEIYDSKTLSRVLNEFFQKVGRQKFLLVIDEVTYVQNWDRVIKARADEGFFHHGVCLLTGSDTFILKEAAMRFPGRRGEADKTDFHLYPLSFSEYVDLLGKTDDASGYFEDYLLCGGYLRAINDLAKHNEIKQATYLTYEEWVRGDFLKRGKSEETLLDVIAALMTVGVSQISFSKLTQKIGNISKETCMDYCRILERMDVNFNLQAYDQNKRQGFPRKDRKFHFSDPFICRAMRHWLMKEGRIMQEVDESFLVESCVASHCRRFGRSFYFKGQGEVDVIYLKDQKARAIEVKWSSQLRANDLKMLKQFDDSIVLTKNLAEGSIEHTLSMPVWKFLLENCVGT